MTVYKDYDVAIEALEKYSADTKEDVYLTYISYGEHPKSLEFQLKTKTEIVNPKKPVNCLAVYRVGKGLKVIKEINELKENKDFREDVVVSYTCGMFAPSYKNRVVETKCLAL